MALHKIKDYNDSAIVSNFPSNPMDGQTVFYQTTAMAASGTVWHLRYRSTSSSAYKWEAFGATPLYTEMGATSAGQGPSYTYSTGWPSIFLTRPGEYLFEWWHGGSVSSAATYAYARPVIPSTGAFLGNDSYWRVTSAGDYGQGTKGQLFTLNGNFSVSMALKAAVGTYTVEGWNLRVIPRRLG